MKSTLQIYHFTYLIMRFQGLKHLPWILRDKNSKRMSDFDWIYWSFVDHITYNFQGIVFVFVRWKIWIFHVEVNFPYKFKAVAAFLRYFSI